MLSEGCRWADRYRFMQSERFDGIGLRVAMSSSGSHEHAEAGQDSRYGAENY